MDKRYQVFVSSTYEDLRRERQEAIQSLLEHDCIPSGMELFPASNEDQWSLIKRMIDECDYYIVISAGRYGSMSSTGLSYTESNPQGGCGVSPICHGGVENSSGETIAVAAVVRT